jgi:type II secretory pathway pseudopilin PulG
MMQIVKKSYFTLLELLIVLFIISFGVILTGVKIKEVYREQRFLSAAHQVLNHLAMAQDLMLIMDTDVQVKIAPDQEKEHLTIWLEIEKPIEEPWARLMERKLSLAAIQSFEFEGSRKKELTLQFSLGQMSKGTLILFEEEQGKGHRSEKREFKITLLGYPSPIGAPEKVIEEQKKSERSELLYPVEVYEQLYSGSNEKNSATKT